MLYPIWDVEEFVIQKLKNPDFSLGPPALDEDWVRVLLGFSKSSLEGSFASCGPRTLGGQHTDLPTVHSRDPVQSQMPPRAPWVPQGWAAPAEGTPVPGISPWLFSLRQGATGARGTSLTPGTLYLGCCLWGPLWPSWWWVEHGPAPRGTWPQSPGCPWGLAAL